MQPSDGSGVMRCVSRRDQFHYIYVYAEHLDPDFVYLLRTSADLKANSGSLFKDDASTSLSTAYTLISILCKTTIIRRNWTHQLL